MFAFSNMHNLKTLKILSFIWLLIIKYNDVFFIKYNDIENSMIDHDNFFLYQEFISKLSKEKYRKDIFKHIIEEIRVNNI